VPLTCDDNGLVWLGVAWLPRLLAPEFGLAEGASRRQRPRPVTKLTGQRQVDIEIDSLKVFQGVLSAEKERNPVADALCGAQGARGRGWHPSNWRRRIRLALAPSAQ
jgi:hypothetical protein